MPIKSDPNGQYKCLALLLLTRPSLFLDALVTTQMGCAIPKNIRALLSRMLNILAFTISKYYYFYFTIVSLYFHHFLLSLSNPSHSHTHG